MEDPGGGRPSRQERRRRRLERARARALARQPYVVKQVAALAADPGLAPAGRVTVCRVLHEDWCPRLSGGLCRCDPDLVWETDG